MSQSPLKLSVVVLHILAGILQVASDCEVLVQEPWPMPQLLVPNGSNVEINCTAPVGTVDPPFWAIDLAADSSTTRLQFINRKGQLNARGVYELPRIETPLTLRLLINDTAINNQTEINCEPGTETITTILYVFDPTPLTLKVLDVGVRSVNLTWDLSVGGAAQSFLLTISHGSSSDNMSLNESYYHFIAPEGAPPCEVYNFSVTATYVGATYTGAGCSVPSPAISTMLPSLPFIGDLQSYYNFSIEKQAGEAVLTVYFQPASYCADYPVTNYSLEVTELRAEEDTSGMIFTSVENLIKAENLSEDAIYVFRLSASNSVGTVSTNLSQEIYTSDVQAARVVATGDSNRVRVECEFILGSDAEGCVVVLLSTGEVNNTTLNSTRENNSSRMAVTQHELPSPLHCYYQAYALDIESDGSIGSLPVPGVLDLADTDTAESCSPTDTPRPPSEPRWVIGVGVAAVLVLLIIALAVLTISVICIKRFYPKYKRKSGRFSIVSTNSFEGSAPLPNALGSTPMYAVVDKSKKRERRSLADGVENHKTSSELLVSTELDSERVTGVRMILPTNEVGDVAPDSEPPPDYGEVCEQQTNEHMIEGLTPVHLIEPTVVPPPNVDPTYQEVVELPDTNTAPTSHVELVTSSSPSLPVHSTADSTPISGPIYQEVGELPERRTPVNETDNQDNGVTEPQCHNEHDSEVRLTPVQAAAPDSTDMATLPLYQEVSNVVQNGVPTDSNKVADDNDLIKLSDTRDLSAVDNDIEEVNGRFSPPQFVGANQGPFGGIHPDRLYDEVTERPRVISPANFAKATNVSPEPNFHTSPVQNASPTPPNSSPLPTYATVTPRSARSRGTVENPEQPGPQNESPEFVHTSRPQNFTPPPSNSSPIPPYATVTPPSVRSRRTVDQPPRAENESPELFHTSQAQGSTPPLPGSSPIPPYATVTPPSVRSRRAVDTLDQPQIDNDSPEEWYNTQAENSTPPPPGSSPLRTYATVTPRSVRSRGNNHSSSPEPLHSSRIQNSTPPPPNSSPLPAYSAVAPHSASLMPSDNVLEQAPKLELASPTGFQPYPLSPQYNFADGRYLPPEDNFLDEWDDYKIPPEGTLV